MKMDKAFWVLVLVAGPMLVLAELRDCRKFGGMSTKRGYFRVCS